MWNGILIDKTDNVGKVFLFHYEGMPGVE